MHLKLITGRFRCLIVLVWLLPLLSIQAGCAPHLTASSIARTERPMMPDYPPVLAQREKLPRLESAPSGRLIRIDEAYWREHNELLAAALGAIERLNRRNAGAELLWRCTRERFATGKIGKGCLIPDRSGSR